VPSLKDIRRRIGSVKNTQQITKAMKMVAAAKLRRAQNAIAGARSFSDKLQDISEDLLRDLLRDHTSELLKGDEAASKVLEKLHPLLSSQRKTDPENPDESAKKKVALLVIASDRGLCGAYNGNMLKMGWRRYHELLASQDEEPILFLVGRRAFDFFKRRKVEGFFFDDVWVGRFDLKKADVVASTFEEKFLAGDFDTLEVCYTKFQSAISQTALVRKVLPMSIEVASIVDEQPVDGKLPTPSVVEPDRKELFSKLLPEQLRMTVYSMLADSYASEFGSRMTAMDNATRNAGDMIARLTLQSNRLRQASITTELMEIIGGAEALKG